MYKSVSLMVVNESKQKIKTFEEILLIENAHISHNEY